MKKNRNRVLFLCILLLLGIYCWRVIALNQIFPKNKLYLVSEGGELILNDLKYYVKGGEIITGKDVKELYNNIEFEDNEEFLIVTFWVKNDTENEHKVDVMSMIGQCGTWANGMEYSLIYDLNGDDFDTIVQADSSSEIKVGFLINTDVEQLTNSNNQWKVQITEWPNRCSMVVPMEEK